MLRFSSLTHNSSTSTTTHIFTTMDTTPLYSAEQIVVPEELADVLKQYTKAVIRAQPTNILEFSAKYAYLFFLSFQVLFLL